MPRNRKRKANRGLTNSKEELQQAVDEVKLRNMSLVDAARHFNIATNRIRQHSENIVKEYGGIKNFLFAQETGTKESFF